MQEFLSESDEVCISCIIVVAMRLFILGVEILRLELSFPTKLLQLFSMCRTCDFLNCAVLNSTFFFFCILYYQICTILVRDLISEDVIVCIP